ncbi:hypothetical protein G6F22_017751 [Rhizopus arrhizus]|nr:hypothetical protein G6F22_017751 [Rhizopus arrhizus]
MGEITVGRFDATGRQFHVLVAQRGFHVAGGQAARGQLVAVQPDAHRVALAATNADLGHAVQAGEAIDHVAIGVVAQFQRVHGRGDHVEPDDRVGIALDLGDFRRARFLRHAVGDAADGIAHVVGRRFDIAVGGEFDADLRAAVAHLPAPG